MGNRRLRQAFKEYCHSINAQSRERVTLRSLLTFPDLSPFRSKR